MRRDEVLSTEEVCRMTGLPKDRVHYLRRRHHLDVPRLGREFMWTLPDVRELERLDSASREPAHTG